MKETGKRQCAQMCLQYNIYWDTYFTRIIFLTGDVLIV